MPSVYNELNCFFPSLVYPLSPNPITCYFFGLVNWQKWNFSSCAKVFRVHFLTCTYFRLNTIAGCLENPMSPSVWLLSRRVHRLLEEELPSQTLMSQEETLGLQSVMVPTVTGVRQSAVSAFLRSWLHSGAHLHRRGPQPNSWRDVLCSPKVTYFRLSIEPDSEFLSSSWSFCSEAFL